MGVTQEWVRYFNICFLRRIWKQKIDPKKQTFAHSVTGRLYCMIISCHLSYTVQWINLLYPSKILKLYQDIKTPQRYDNSGIIACAFLVLVIFCGTDHIGSSMSTVLLKIALKHIRMVDQGANKESSEVIDILLPVTFYFNSSTRLDNVKSFWRFVISDQGALDIVHAASSKQDIIAKKHSWISMVPERGTWPPPPHLTSLHSPNASFNLLFVQYSDLYDWSWCCLPLRTSSAILMLAIARSQLDMNITLFTDELN